MSAYAISQSSLVMSVLSTEPWYTTVAAELPGSSSPEDLASATVKFAFKPVGEQPDTPPDGADWQTGTWETVTTSSGTSYLATVTVGPSGTVTGLTAGEYVVWLYTADSFGDPVTQVGTLTITNL